MSYTCSIIVPVHNQHEYALQCIHSVIENTPAGAYEILIIDNDSGKESAKLLREESTKHAHLRYYRLDQNQGFSFACNKGALHADGAFLIFLNSDTIVRPNWLAELLTVASCPSVGLVGPKLVYPHNHAINHAGYVYNGALHCFYPIYHQLNATFEYANIAREYQAILGACMLISRELFIDLGMFSNHALEDIDLCLKVHEAGYAVQYCPASEVYHYGSLTLKALDAKYQGINSLAAFEERWPVKRRLWDDLEYFKADGFAVDFEGPNQIWLKREDNQAYRLHMQAMAKLREQDLDQGIMLLSDAIAHDPNHYPALLDLALLMCSLEEYPQALNLGQRLYQIDPLIYNAYIFCFHCYNSMGEHEKALNELNKLINKKQLPFDIKSLALRLSKQKSSDLDSLRKHIEKEHVAVSRELEASYSKQSQLAQGFTFNPTGDFFRDKV